MLVLKRRYFLLPPDSAEVKEPSDDFIREDDPAFQLQLVGQPNLSTKVEIHNYFVCV